MRFRIMVADRDTGEESVIELNATTVQDARKTANDAGYLIARIEPVEPDAVASPAVMAVRTIARQRSRTNRIQQSVTAGGTIGAIGGAAVGYYLGGALGIPVGAFAGVIAGMGVAGALTPEGKLTPFARVASGTISVLFSAGLFLGSCIVPLNCLHRSMRSDVEIEADQLISQEHLDPETARKRAAFNIQVRNYEQGQQIEAAVKYHVRMEEYREQARKSLRADGKDPDSLLGSTAHKEEIEARAKAIQKIDEATNPQLKK